MVNPCLFRWPVETHNAILLVFRNLQWIIRVLCPRSCRLKKHEHSDFAHGGHKLFDRESFYVSISLLFFLELPLFPKCLSRLNCDRENSYCIPSLCFIHTLFENVLSEGEPVNCFKVTPVVIY